MHQYFIPFILFSCALISCGDKTPQHDNHQHKSRSDEDSTATASSPKFRLGAASVISIGTRDLKESMDFYQHFGLQLMEEGEDRHRWARVSDGNILIELRQDSSNIVGIKYFTGSFSMAAKRLSDAGAKLINKYSFNESQINEFQIPGNTTKITIVDKYNANMYQPDGITMSNLPQKYFQDSTKFPSAQYGVFGELALPTNHKDSSVAFWEKLGFETRMNSEQPYPWAICTDDFNIIGMHHRASGGKTGLTFFAPNMKTKVQKLKEAGMSNIEAVTGFPDCYTILSPEGNYILMYKL